MKNQFLIMCCSLRAVSYTHLVKVLKIFARSSAVIDYQPFAVEAARRGKTIEAVSYTHLQRIAAEVALEQAKMQSVMAEANARVALEKALQKEKMASDQVAYAEQKAADAKKIVDAQSTAKACLLYTSRCV